MESDEIEDGYSDSTIEDDASNEEVPEIIVLPENEENENAVDENNEASVEPSDNPNEVIHDNPGRDQDAISNDDILVQVIVNDNPNEVIHDNPGRDEDAISDDDILVQNIDGAENATEENVVEVVPVSQSKTRKRSRESDSDDEADSRNVCPICMDKWTNAGEHRLVCLKCGHLFGNSCILRWLDIACPPGQRRCPQCNKKAHRRDIRTLYAHNLQALDTSEYEKLQEEINTLKQEKTRLEFEIARVKLNNTMQQEELKKALDKVKSLEKTVSSNSQLAQSSQPLSQPSAVTRMILESTLEISSADGCRVLEWNSLMCELYVSHNTANSLFPGFSVKKVGIQESRPVLGQSIFLHSKAIRDLAVRPQSKDLLLSVSLDKTAKLLDLSNNSVVSKFNTNTPLWSCSWDCNNLNRFFVGSQNGTVTQFDSRQPNSPLQQLAFPGDLSPVTSLVSLPYCAGRALPQGGILVSKLVSCWAFSQNSSGDQYHGQQLSVEGPFTSLCHEKETDHILISRRPNPRNPNTCHMVCQLQQEGSAIACNIVHNFLAGTAQKQLSRPCLIKVHNDMFVSAYVECRSSINVWNVSSGQTVATVKAYDPVKDICAVQCENKLWFAALSEKNLRMYSMC